MTKKDFFSVVIKLYGLYAAIITIFQTLPTLYSVVWNMREFQLSALLWMLFYAGLGVSFFLLLLFKSDAIVRFLRLEKGFDDDTIIFGNFNDSSVVKLAILLIGGFLILDNFSDFIAHCYFGFKSSIGSTLLEDRSYSERDYFKWFVSAFNVLIGYLFVTNFKKIAGWMLDGSKENSR